VAEAGTWVVRELPRPPGSDVPRWGIWSTYGDGGHWLPVPGASSAAEVLTFVSFGSAEHYVVVNEGPTRPGTGATRGPQGRVR